MFKIYNIFNFNHNSPIVPAKLNLREKNGIKLLSKLPVQAGDEIVTAEVKYCKEKNFTFYKTIVKDLTDNERGIHTYGINKLNSYIEGMYMDTYPKYRGRGIGEVMRLVNIIEMQVNNLKRNKIVSTPSAVLFHHKYKFVPDVNNL